MSNEDFNRDSRSSREGLLALSQAEKLSKQMDDILYNNPFVTLYEVRKRLVPYCITEKYGPMVQGFINQSIDRGLTWQSAPPFKNWLREIYEHEKMVRSGPDGPTSVTHLGTLTGSSTSHKGMHIEDLAPDFFIKNSLAGVDSVIIGGRWFGKTCMWGQQFAKEWMLGYKRHVVSGIECLNPKDFYIDGKPHYHQSNLKSENFMDICKIQLEYLNSGQGMQTIKIGFDEASQEMNKQRSMAKAALDQDNFLAIERHFGGSSDWLFQDPRNIPLSLERFATLKFVKLSRKTVYCTKNLGGYIQMTHVFGLKGLEQLRAKNAPRFEYPVTGKPDFSSWDIDMVSLRFNVNKLSSHMTAEVDDARSDEDKIVDAQIRFFKSVLVVLDIENKKKSGQNGITRAGFIKGLAIWLDMWMEEHGRSGKIEMPISYPTISSVIPETLNVTPDVLSKQVSKVRRERKKANKTWDPSMQVSEDDHKWMRAVLGDDAADNLEIIG